MRGGDRVEGPRATRGTGHRAGRRAGRWALLAGSAALASCGGPPDPDRVEAGLAQQRAAGLRDVERETIWDLFRDSGNPDTTVEVNRFIWDAALDVLDFLPIEAVDPFTGVIVMGYGTPPGGGTPYRATVYVQDPALDARSLNVALATRSGPAPAATQRAVEDAILTRARQLRIAAGRL